MICEDPFQLRRKWFPHLGDLAEIMTGEQEKRKYPRTPVADLWVDVEICSTFIAQNTPAKIINAKVDNISEGGVCLISSDPFELDQIVSFSDPKLSSKGKVVWTSLSKTECKAGIQFLSGSGVTFAQRP